MIDLTADHPAAVLKCRHGMTPRMGKAVDEFDRLHAREPFAVAPVSIAPVVKGRRAVELSADDRRSSASDGRWRGASRSRSAIQI